MFATNQFCEALESRQLLSVDLSVTIASPSPGGELLTGREQQVLVTLANTGSERVRDVSVQVIASTDSTLDPSDLVLGTRRISTLSAGETETEDVEFRIAATVAPGAYTLFAIVDPAGAVAETNESNNTSAGASITIAAGSTPPGGDDDGTDDGPDDNGDDNGSDDNGGVPGGPVDATVSLSLTEGTTLSLAAEQRVLFVARNLENGRIDPRVPVALYASTDATLDTSTDTLLASRGVTLHDAFEVETEDFEFRLSPSMAPGNYFLFAVVDGSNDIAETREDNNISQGVSVVISGSTVPSGSPDLTVSIISPLDGSTIATRRQRVSVLATNLGTGSSAQRPIVSIFASSDSTFSPETDTLLTSRAISPISGRESELESLEFTSTLTPGTYTLFAVIDRANAVTESDETNNVSGGVSITFTSTPPSAGLPDLRISLETEPGDDSLRLGTQERVFVSVANMGNGNARASTVRLHASLDDTLDPAEDRILASSTFSAVRAGQSLSRPILFTVPAGVNVGEYQIYATVDDGGGTESDESNNRSESYASSIDVGSFNLAGTISQSRVPDSIIEGSRARGSLRVNYQNTGGDSFLKGSTMGIQAFLRPANAADATQDVAVSRIKTESLSSKSAGRAAQISVDIPATVTAGTYTLVIKLDVLGQIAELNEADNEIAGVQISIAAPFVDVAVTTASTTFATSAAAGSAARGTLTLSNLGNVTARASMSLVFSLVDGNGTETLLSSPLLRQSEVRPGRPLAIRNVQLLLPADQTAGEYTLRARATVSNLTDANPSNNQFTLVGVFTVL